MTIRYAVDKILFPFCRLFPCLNEVSFTVLKIFSFMRPHILIVLTACANGFCLESLFCASELKPIPPFLFYHVHCIWFMLRSLIYLKLSFVQDDKNGSISIPLHAAVHFDQHHLLKMFSLFQCVSLASL